ncbi:MAG TPA: transglutaminase domain-containing protein [Burkholderiales bacterium]|nr:transglutaminase domain-containing protein [Burkholderiales bacterium]
MDRRSFLKAGALVPAAAVLPRLAHAQQLPFEPRQAEKWRTFEVSTRVEILFPEGTSRVWLPVPSVDSGYQKPIDNAWSGNAQTAKLLHDGKYGAGMLYAEWSNAEKNPVVELTSRFATRDRAVDLSSRLASGAKLDAGERAFYTEATEHMPTDGIVKQTAQDVTKGARSDYDKAKAIYEWIVDNTYRDPKTRGCGVGDIKTMLETGNLGGKCADLNALYVGLARASGLPARDVYGVRVAKSQFGYRSLGAGTANITRAQHCRAEVYLTGFGWVPVDPADVRKVVLEEKAQPTTLSDPLVQAVRPKLFGAWEMNWLAFNTANDIVLPNANKGKITFFMYPQAETAAGRVDSLDPDNFKYTMTARELTA